MYKYEVGQLFQDGITMYPEGTKFDFTQGGPVLIMFLERPTEKEIQQVKSGRLQIGFWYKDDVIFVLFKFGSLNWMDAPYNVHLSEPFTFEEIVPNSGFGLHVFLVDAATGIIKAMRLIGLGTTFSIQLKKAIEKQKNAAFDESLYDKAIMRVYGNYSTNDMIKYADIIYKGV